MQTPVPAQGPAPQGLVQAAQGQSPAGSGMNSPAARILMAAAKLIYTDPKPFLDIIRSAPNPQEGILRCVDIILKHIAQSIKGVPPQTIQQLLPIAGQKLGPMIGRLLAEIAMAAGLIPGGKGAPPAGAQPPVQPGAQPGAQPAQPGAQP